MRSTNPAHAALLPTLLALALSSACGDDADAGDDSTSTGSADSSGGTTATSADSSGGADASSSGSSGAVDTSSGAESTTGELGPTPIVLVHGAWMGAWAWDEVTPLLEAAGHPTVVVELPAHGDDPTAPADATLEGYRDAVLTALDGLDQPAAVVGHSMGGMVISEVAQARPDDVESLVYVAAFLPRNGESLFALGMADPDSQTAAHLVDNGDGTFSLDPAFIGEVFCGDCTDEAVALIVDRTRPEPAGPLLSPSTVTDDVFGAVRKTYVRTEQDAAVSPAGQDAMVAATPVDELRSIATSHSPFLSQPQLLADTIVELVESGG
jgi:pimeloyl-ACP methyl ester carboxylesterase